MTPNKNLVVTLVVAALVTMAITSAVRAFAPASVTKYLPA